MIAGNKADMESQRRVPKQEADSYAKENNVKHHLVSAKSGLNINELFLELAEAVYETKKKNDKLMMGGKGRNLRIKVE